MPNNGQVTDTDPPSTGTSLTEPRKSTGFAAILTTVLEAVGVLNKGSAGSAATPKIGDAAQTAGISSNALNVTRVGGLAALISGAGAAAIAVFNVNKGTDKASIVVAAYISVGVIVAAALLTAAIIISSDIRARVAASAPPPALGPASTDAAKAEAAAAKSFRDAWYRALSMLHDAVDKLERTPESPADGWLDGSTAAWLDAVASTGKTQDLHPADDAQASLHAGLRAGQSSVVSLLGKLANGRNPSDKTETVRRIRSVLSSMDHSLPWPA
jgi:hypothetical protein